jgi:alanine racemase
MTQKSKISFLEISSANLVSNILTLKNQVQNSLFGIVVKGNAYGHGLREIVSATYLYVDVYFVILVSDAIEIRSLEHKSHDTFNPHKKNKRIVVIGAISEHEIEDIIQYNLEVSISDDLWVQFLHRIKKIDKKIKAHVFIETGLYREGFEGLDILSRYSFLKEHTEKIEVVAAFSHFANTEDVTEQEYALSQLKRFDEGVKLLQNLLNLSLLERHFAASAAAILLPSTHFDMVRVGIAAYGIWPSAETRISAKLNASQELISLASVLSWKCLSQVIKKVPAGSFIGYGCSFKCQNETFIAVLPLGYFDGYFRSMSQKAYVLVQGIRCPVIGRIMMNHIIVDVSQVHNIHNLTEVEAVLLGESHSGQKMEKITAEMLSAWAGTIPYELLARLPRHLERRLII